MKSPSYERHSPPVHDESTIVGPADQLNSALALLARIGGHTLSFDRLIRHPRRSCLPTVRATIRPLHVQSSRPSHVRQVPMPRGGERVAGGGMPATAIYTNHNRRHVITSASHIATSCQIKRFWNLRRGSGHPSNRSVCWIVS